jgi:hypothetical protein
MDIKEFAQKFMEAEYEAWQDGNFESLEQIESPDMTIHMPPIPDLKGFEGHEQYIMTACESMKDLTVEGDYITGDGNVAVFSFKMAYTLTADNPLLQISAGSTIDVDGFMVLRRENDRVAEIWIKSSMTTK